MTTGCDYLHRAMRIYLLGEVSRRPLIAAALRAPRRTIDAAGLTADTLTVTTDQNLIITDVKW